MGKPPATRLLKLLEPGELRQVTRAAAQLGAVPMAALESLVEEFTSEFSAGANLLGDIGQARDMLSDAMPPDQVADIMSDVLAAADANVWLALGSVPEAVLSTYLSNEHALIATFILSKLNPALAAQIVSHLPRDARNEVLCAMIVAADDLRRSAPRHRRRRAQGFGDSLRRAPPGSTIIPASPKSSTILNPSTPATSCNPSSRRGRRRPRSCRRCCLPSTICRASSQRARATLFDKLQTEIIVLALRGTDAEFRDARALLDGVAGAPPRRGRTRHALRAAAREVAKARRKIVDLVLKMAQRNEIEILRPTAPKRPNPSPTRP